jgi:hypothetical protein
MTLSKDEKEKRVIELYKKGYTRAQIAHEVKMSLKTIQYIIRRYEDSLPSAVPGKSSQAFELFKDELSPLDVAIKLDIPAKTAIEYYLDFMKLVGLAKFADVYQELGNKVADFVGVYYQMKSKNITAHNLAEAMRTLALLPDILGEHAKISSELQNMQLFVSQAKEDLKNVNNEIQLSRNISILECCRLQNLIQEVQKKQEEYNNLDGALNKVSKDYRELKNIIQSEAKTVLGNHSSIIQSCMVAVLNVLPQDPMSQLRFRQRRISIEEFDRLVQSAETLVKTVTARISEKVTDNTIESLSREQTETYTFRRKDPSEEIRINEIKKILSHLKSEEVPDWLQELVRNLFGNYLMDSIIEQSPSLLTLQVHSTKPSSSFS